MNIRQIKQNIDLKSFLIQYYGFVVERSRGAEHWGKSLFRPEEHTASFRVNDAYQVYTDFGEAGDRHRGDVVDFIRQYHNCEHSEAIKRILELVQSFSFSLPQRTNVSGSKTRLDSVKKNYYNLKKVVPLSNPSLLAFLNRKCLDIKLCRKYLKEVHFGNPDGKTYYGVGLKNNSNSYEVAYQVWNREQQRFRSIKKCIGRKDYAFLDNSAKSVLVTESWSDCLAFISCYPRIPANNDLLILNSLTMLDKIPTLSRYQTIYSLLDNDDPGKAGSKKIFQQYPDRVVPLNHLYFESKDFNEHWIQLKSKAGFSQIF